MWQVHKHHDLFPRRWPPSEPCSQLSGRPLSEGMVQRVLQREEVGGQGRGSGPPLKEELNAALELSHALTSVNQAPGGLRAQQAAYNDQLHAHIHNMVDLAEQVDTRLAQLYARAA